ncbi:MAG TPA: sulfurtransferase-like selenium metabolism protein YedF, partial [Geobacteraceae bacterium]|nr:sulfurtransferase-like selenium metabolism protein YedF [Geobacteraceae bacterium]
MHEIDCRNLPCPGPVIKAKKALEGSSGEQVRIILDAGAARENVARFATSRGYRVEEEQLADGFALTIVTGNVQSPVFSTNPSFGGAVILVASDRLGSGPDDLGKLLMKNFLISLLEVIEPPEKIFFLNSGVLLTVSGAETIESLEKLAAVGVEIMSCGICLDFFSVRNKLAVGSVTDM